MLLKNKYLYLSLLTIAGLVSCDKNRVFDQYANVENGKWNSEQAYVFDFESKDTITPYNLFINVRLTNDFAFSNLFLIVETHSPSNKTTVDTLEYLMAKPDGTLLGTGISDVKESKLWFKENETLNEIGNYKFRVYQAVRETGKVNGVKDLDGVSEVGLRIEKILNDE